MAQARWYPTPVAPRATHTVGGGSDQQVAVGHAPEHRAWKPGDPVFKPIIESTARLEWGVTVDAGMNESTYVGNRTWLMKKVHVGHDARVGDDCEIAPMVSIGGHVVIGDRVKVGQSAVFKPGVHVGDDAVIGCGAIIVKDVPAGEVWISPAATRLR